MAAPVLKYVRREERERDGISSFKEWAETPSHIYIGHNIRQVDLVRIDNIFFTEAKKNIDLACLYDYLLWRGFVLFGLKQ